MPQQRKLPVLKAQKLWFNFLSGAKIFDFASAVRLLYHNCGIYAAAAVAACAESTEIMIQCSLRRQNL